MPAEWHEVDLGDPETAPPLEGEVWAFLPAPKIVTAARTQEIMGDGGLTGRDKDVWWLSAKTGHRIHADQVSHWHAKTGEYVDARRPPPPAD